jgi:drug/metabolite transporter (DMT)-like permease
MRDSWFSWLLFVILCLIWGSSFYLMKVGMDKLSAYQVASLRMLTAGLVLLPFVKKAWQSIPRNRVGLVMRSGLLGSFFPAYLFCLAETKIDSAMAGILNALTPLFTLLVGILFFQLKARKIQIIGTCIGFLGLVLLITTGNEVHLSNLSYSFLVMAATLMYGFNVNMVGRYMRGFRAIDIAALAFVMLIIPSLIILLMTGYGSLSFWQGEYLQSTLAAGILGILATAIASILFYILVKRAGPVFASMVTYGIPIVAIGWGLLRHEYIGDKQVLSLLIILAGVYLVNRPEKKKPDREASGL